jgi:hypothetical protein
MRSRKRRVDELEAVLGQGQLAHEGRQLAHRVHARADVVEKARQRNLAAAARAAPEGLVALRQQHRPAGLRQRDRRTQAVRPRPHHDRVVFLLHVAAESYIVSGRRRLAIFEGTCRLRELLTMEPAEAVLRFLAGVGRGSEAEFYLRLFRTRSRESFAALVIDGATMRENADAVALDLRLLHTLSLTPVVVLGFHDGGGAQAAAAQLQDKLRVLSVPSALIDAPRRLSADDRAGAIAAAAKSCEIPVVTLNGESSQLIELAAMLSGLRTHKLIFLRNEGALTLDGQRLSVVNLSDEFGGLWARPDWTESQRAMLTASQRIVLELVAHELVVSITSPLSLLHELFTVKGAGTMLRRGARIERHEGLWGVDMPRLEGTLESSFGKALLPNALARDFTAVYIEQHYRGAALLTTTRLGSYLSKFAVTREAQGEGIGRDLWQAMIAEHPVLFWRAREGNEIRSWYEKQCDGRVRAREWTVYFKGLAPERIPEAIGHALAQPLDF